MVAKVLVSDALAPQGLEVLRAARGIEVLDQPGLAPGELLERIGDVEDYEVAGPSGAPYQLSIQAMWDDAPNGDLRIIGAIDDGGWRAFFPLTDSFIMTPDGDLVGE